MHLIEEREFGFHKFCNIFFLENGNELEINETI